MTSDKQIEANRKNAEKSTGPRSKKGKDKSKLNGVTHSLDAETPLFPWECTEQYRNHCLGWLQDLKPEGTVETQLVLRAAHNEWVLRRADKAEHNLIMNAPSMVEAERHMMREALLKNRLMKNTRMVMDELRRHQAARKAGEALDPPPDNKKYKPPEITYVIVFPEVVNTQAFPEDMPYDADRPDRNTRQARRQFEAMVRDALPQTPEEERYPVAQPDAAPEDPPMADPQMEAFYQVLDDLPNPGQEEVEKLFFKRRTGIRPKLAHCYPLRIQVPEAYPQKMGSLRIFYPPLAESSGTSPPDPGGSGGADPAKPDPGS